MTARKKINWLANLQAGLFAIAFLLVITSLFVVLKDQRDGQMVLMCAAVLALLGAGLQLKIRRLK